MLACLPLPREALADDVEVRDGSTSPVTVSAKELTRLAMADGSRLEKLIGAEGTLEVKADADTGTAFIRPVDATAGRSFSFFVRDDRGATYTLAATVANVPSQTVRLRPAGRAPLARAATAAGRTDPYQRRVKALVRAMAMDDPAATGFGFETIGRVVPLWDSTQTVIEQRWTSGDDLSGEVWSIRNLALEDLQLDETQFSTLYPDVRAVAIGTASLGPTHTTRVFVVRGAPGDGS